MNSSRAAVFLCLLSGASAVAQDANPAGTARANLESLATKGDARQLSQALARRGGDWFDVVRSVVAEPMPALEPTKALIAALPEPEQKGVKALLDQIAAAPPATRQSFAAALGALMAVTRTFADSRGDPKALGDAVALA